MCSTLLALVVGLQARLSNATVGAILGPLMGAFNDKVAKIRKLAVQALSKVGTWAHGLRFESAVAWRLWTIRGCVPPANNSFVMSRCHIQWRDWGSFESVILGASSGGQGAHELPALQVGQQAYVPKVSLAADRTALLCI